MTHLILGGTLERCPGLRLIVPHAGGTIPFLVDRISLLAARFVPGTATRAPAGVEAYLRRLYYSLCPGLASSRLLAGFVTAVEVSW